MCEVLHFKQNMEHFILLPSKNVFEKLKLYLSKFCNGINIVITSNHF